MASRQAARFVVTRSKIARHHSSGNSLGTFVVKQPIHKLLSSQFSGLSISPSASSSSPPSSLSLTTTSHVHCFTSPLTPNHRPMSTMSAKDDENREIVTFLGLNNLSDNPGAVKRVSHHLTMMETLHPFRFTAYQFRVLIPSLPNVRHFAHHL